MIRLLLGIVLIGVATVLLILMVQGPDNETVASIMTSLHCEQGEKFIQILGPYTISPGSRSSGSSVTFYCETEPGGRRRDVTMPGVLTIMGAFTVPFLIGLGLTMWGAFAMIWRAVRGTVSAASRGRVELGGPNQPITFGGRDGQSPGFTSTVVTVNGREVKQSDWSELPPETTQLVQQMLSGLNVTMRSMDKTAGTVGDVDLADRLQQLQEARDKGLITADEYERVRKAILDNMRQ